jgi:hypothetical protein
MIVMGAMVDAMVIVIVVVDGTNSGIGFFAKFEVSTNVGKIRVMLDREQNGG